MGVGGAERLRGDEAALYERYAERLWHEVRAAVAGPDELVDEACRRAWVRLLANSDEVDRAIAWRWLRTTAIRQTWHLAQDADRPAGSRTSDQAEARTAGVELTSDELARRTADSSAAVRAKLERGRSRIAEPDRGSDRPPPGPVRDRSLSDRLRDRGDSERDIGP